ncbi:MAG TPA: MerR family transcriptional regulator [Acidimicrobiales bacterium]|nr:MerR family transcriptional regulator [Acidimicrobiales bacterium]
MAERAHLSIGEVLSLVQEDFPDITISKIRFLESQGLLDPERTPSGYRKFYESDIERLQWILTQQRDHFLPLKVIRDRLDEWDATGQRPAPDAGGPAADDDVAAQRWDDTPPEVPLVADPEPERAPVDDVRHAAASLASATAIEVVSAPDVPDSPDLEPEPLAVPEVVAPPAPPEPLPSPDERSLTAEELAARAGVAVSVVGELEGFSMISSRRVGPETYYDIDQLPVVAACKAFLDRGVEVRHLRMYKIAAEREAGVLEQLIMPLLKQRNPEARARAVATVEELSEAGESLHRALLRHALRHTLPDRP